MTVDRRNLARWLVGLAAAAALVPAQAVAVSTAVFADGPASIPAGAPNILSAKVESTEAGEIRVEVQLDKPMTFLEFDYQVIGGIQTYLDLDNNPATTGSDPDLPVGAETMVRLYNNGSGIYGQIDSIPLLDSFNSDASTALVTWTGTNIAHLGLTPGRTIGVRFASTEASTGDFLPDLVGGKPVWLAYQVSPAAPPAPVLPVPVVAAPATPAPVVSPPIVRAATPAPLIALPLKLSQKDGKIGARFGWGRGSGQVKWALKLSARVRGKLISKTVRGNSSSGFASLTPRVSFAAPIGTRITGSLTVRNNGRTLIRTAVLVKRA